MPRLPINYENTQFYKIVCRDLDVEEIYVEHTTDFNRRKSQHKHMCSAEGNKDYNMKLYVFIRSQGGWANFDMILIETRSCETALEARKIERTYIESLGSTLNQTTPGRDRHAYNLDCKDKISHQCKVYQEVNKEAISQQRKIYRETHKEEIKQLLKQYRDTHREELNQYLKN